MHQFKYKRANPLIKQSISLMWYTNTVTSGHTAPQMWILYCICEYCTTTIPFLLFRPVTVFTLHCSTNGYIHFTYTVHHAVSGWGVVYFGSSEFSLCICLHTGTCNNLASLRIVNMTWAHNIDSALLLFPTRSLALISWPSLLFRLYVCSSNNLQHTSIFVDLFNTFLSTTSKQLFALLICSRRKPFWRNW